MNILKTKGILNDDGRIVLNSFKTIKWADFSSDEQPKLPSGTSLEFSVSFDENIFLSGVNGIVWGTFDMRQAEIIQNTLLAQHINSEIKTVKAGLRSILLIKISSEKDVHEAREFIWSGNRGLRLKPDWNYPEGEVNKSFEQWLSGQ